MPINYWSQFQSAIINQQWYLLRSIDYTLPTDHLIQDEIPTWVCCIGLSIQLKTTILNWVEMSPQFKIIILSWIVNPMQQTQVGITELHFESNDPLGECSIGLYWSIPRIFSWILFNIDHHSHWKPKKLFLVHLHNVLFHLKVMVVTNYEQHFSLWMSHFSYE